MEDERPTGRAHVAQCDARRVGGTFRRLKGSVKAVVTSPPYLDTTRFEEDQWLRLWFLGGPPRPTYYRVSRDDRHRYRRPYWLFLEAAWRGIAPLLDRSAVLVCRLGAKAVPLEELRDGVLQTLNVVWSSVKPLTDPRISASRNRQTVALNKDATGCRFEVDFVWRVGRQR